MIFFLFIYTNALGSPIIMVTFPVIIIFYLCSNAFNAFTVTVQPWQSDTSGYISGQMKWFISLIKVSYQSWWADMYPQLSSWKHRAGNAWTPDWQERAELGYAKPRDGVHQQVASVEGTAHPYTFSRCDTGSTLMILRQAEIFTIREISSTVLTSPVEKDWIQNTVCHIAQIWCFLSFLFFLFVCLIHENAYFKISVDIICSPMVACTWFEFPQSAAADFSFILVGELSANSGFIT